MLFAGIECIATPRRYPPMLLSRRGGPSCRSHFVRCCLLHGAWEVAWPARRQSSQRRPPPSEVDAKAVKPRKTAPETALNTARKSRSRQISYTVRSSWQQPQIAKADGDAPVQAYIAAMPGWKRDVGRGLDALIVRTVPGVRKRSKWNSPLYGVEGQGWFLGMHCFTNYVKVAFFRGTSLHPVPRRLQEQGYALSRHP